MQCSHLNTRSAATSQDGEVVNVLNVSNSDRDPFEALDVDIDSQRRRDDEGSGGVKASYSQEVPGLATISIFSVYFN